MVSRVSMLGIIAGAGYLRGEHKPRMELRVCGHVGAVKTIVTVYPRAPNSPEKILLKYFRVQNIYDVYMYICFLPLVF